MLIEGFNKGDINSKNPARIWGISRNEDFLSELIWELFFMYDTNGFSYNECVDLVSRNSCRITNVYQHSKRKKLHQWINGNIYFCKKMQRRAERIQWKFILKFMIYCFN